MFVWQLLKSRLQEIKSYTKTSANISISSQQHPISKVIWDNFDVLLILQSVYSHYCHYSVQSKDKFLKTRSTRDFILIRVGYCLCSTSVIECPQFNKRFIQTGSFTHKHTIRVSNLQTKTYLTDLLWPNRRIYTYTFVNKRNWNMTSAFSFELTEITFRSPLFSHFLHSCSLFFDSK